MTKEKLVIVQSDFKLISGQKHAFEGFAGPFKFQVTLEPTGSFYMTVDGTTFCIGIASLKEATTQANLFLQRYCEILEQLQESTNCEKMFEVAVLKCVLGNL